MTVLFEMCTKEFRGPQTDDSHLIPLCFKLTHRLLGHCASAKILQLHQQGSDGRNE